jgi:hypothetical protein
MPIRCDIDHGLEWGRVVARQRFEDHVRCALVAGAYADVAHRTIILPMYDHLRVAAGTEEMPPCIFRRVVGRGADAQAKSLGDAPAVERCPRL